MENKNININTLPEHLRQQYIGLFKEDLLKKNPRYKTYLEMDFIYNENQNSTFIIKNNKVYYNGDFITNNTDKFKINRFKFIEAIVSGILCYDITFGMALKSEFPNPIKGCMLAIMLHLKQASLALHLNRLDLLKIDKRSIAGIDLSKTYKNIKIVNTITSIKPFPIEYGEVLACAIRNYDQLYNEIIKDIDYDLKFMTSTTYAKFTVTKSEIDEMINLLNELDKNKEQHKDQQDNRKDEAKGQQDKNSKDKAENKQEKDNKNNNTDKQDKENQVEDSSNNCDDNLNNNNTDNNNTDNNDTDNNSTDDDSADTNYDECDNEDQNGTEDFTWENSDDDSEDGTEDDSGAMPSSNIGKQGSDKQGQQLQSNKGQSQQSQGSDNGQGKQSQEDIISKYMSYMPEEFGDMADKMPDFLDINPVDIASDFENVENSKEAEELKKVIASYSLVGEEYNPFDIPGKSKKGSEQAWYEKLQAILESKRSKPVYSYIRPNKRLQHLGITVPGPSYLSPDGINRIVVYLDVSSSIREDMANTFFRLIKNLEGKFPDDNKMFTFNTKLKKVDIKRDKHIKIGGGTKIDVVADSIKEQIKGGKGNDTLFLILTDGEYDSQILTDVIKNLKVCIIGWNFNRWGMYSKCKQTQLYDIIETGKKENQYDLIRRKKGEEHANNRI